MTPHRCCEVLIGVPSYGPGVPSHNPHAETLQIALKGIRNAAADRNFNPNTLTGVALFADYTTEAEEWAEFARDWANK